MSSLSFAFNFQSSSIDDSLPPTTSSSTIPPSGEDHTSTTTAIAHHEGMIDYNSTLQQRSCLVSCPVLQRDTIEMEDLCIEIDESKSLLFQKVFLKTSPEVARESDLIPGIYEGGYKVWECSLDIAKIIMGDSDTFDSIVGHKPQKLLELGCGTAIPAIVAMMTHESITEVVLTDFNEEVLETVSWPHAILNLPSEKLAYIRCIAGDWIAASMTVDLLQGQTFDLILSAETLYNSDCCQKLYHMIEHHLDPVRGVALIASKRYYFGVGGGTLLLENLLRSPNSTLTYEKILCIEDCQSNIREVLKLTKKRS